MPQGDLQQRFLPVTTAERLLATPGACVIDLRSPSEFAHDHLPGAHNVPLFDDEERALIGWLYRQRSPEAAFDEGLQRVLAGVRELVHEVAELAAWEVPEEDLEARVRDLTAGGIEPLSAELETETVHELQRGAVVCHCWRGGMRSRSVVALLRSLGLTRAVGLAGGYKSYRGVVREELASWRAPRAFVLRGLTGVGKTLVLRAIEALRPGWTFDLEELAGHRSSLLGMVGLEPVSQKGFESRTAARLRTGFPGPVVFEGESRKVGDAIVPAAVWECLRGGVNIELVAGTERRVDVLVEDYLEHESDRPELRAQLAILETRTEKQLPLVAWFDSGRERELVRELLGHYYDPLYRRSERGFTYSASVDSTDPAVAAEEIVRWVEAHGAQEIAPA